MAFQAPRIIGGGQIIQPQAQGNPFAGISDETNIYRDRELKKKALELEARNLYADLDIATSGEGHVPFEEWYGADQQGGGGGFLGMVGQGIKGGAGMVGKGLQGGAGFLQKAGQTMLPGGERGFLGPKSYEGVSPYAPDTSEQWEGRPSPELGPLQRAGNWMKENVFNQQGFQGEGGGSGIGPLQKAPESEYQKQLHGGTAQQRDPYGYNNVQEDTGGAPKENIFTKAKDFITRPSKRKYESSTEEGREMVKNLDLKDNDAVAEFQKLMGLEADGVAGKDTIAVIRALRSGEHEKATSGYRPDMQIIGRQQGGYSLEGGGDVPGNDTGDKNPAMLEDGEYVLNRNAVKALGKGFLDHINDERYPRFQSGGFQEPDIAGGTAQLVQPPVMDNSEAFSFGGGGGGEEGGGGMDMGMLMKLAPMLMGAPPMQRGGHIPGYQFGGGFSAPGGGGARAQIIRPPVMDNSGAFDFGGGDNLGGAPQGGNDPVITQTTTPEGGQTTGDFSNVDMDWQSGGHVPKYQQGGTVRRPTGYQMGGYRPSTRTGMITNEELEQSQRNEDWKSDVRRMGAGYNYDVNKYQKDIDETYKDAGISHWNPLNLIPGVWDKEQYQEEAQRHKDEYAREHMEEAFDPSKVPSNVRMDQEGYQLLQEHGGVPEQSKDARLSSDALKKRWWESMNPEGYDASEWIEQWFGNQTN